MILGLHIQTNNIKTSEKIQIFQLIIECTKLNVQIVNSLETKGRYSVKVDQKIVYLQNTKKCK